RRRRSRASSPALAPRPRAPASLLEAGLGALAKLRVAPLLLAGLAPALDQPHGRRGRREHPPSIRMAARPAGRRLRTRIHERVEALAAALALELVDRHCLRS